MRFESDAPIGLFDSGIGGLTLLRQLKKDLPSESIVFIGDSKNMPYGPRSEEDIEKLSFACCDYLMDHGVKMIVIACNTISSVCYEKIKKAYEVPVVEVLKPSIENALFKTKKSLAIVGTERTIAMGIHKKIVEESGKDVLLWDKAIYPLASAIEEMQDDLVIDAILQSYFQDMPEDIDTLLLACTHYPLIKNNLSKMFKGVCILDASEPTAALIKRELYQRGQLSQEGQGSLSLFFTKETDIVLKMKERYGFILENSTSNSLV